MFESIRLLLIPNERMESTLPLPECVAALVEQLSDSHPFLRGKEWDLPRLLVTEGGTSIVGREVFEAYVALHAVVVQTCERWPGSSEGRPLLRPKNTNSTLKDSTRPDGGNPKDGDRSLMIDWDGERYVWVDLFSAYDKNANVKDLGGLMGIKNTKQIIWDLQHMLWENVNRRFAVGMTIEQTEARLWVATRSAMLVSMGFDTQMERKRLFRTFAFFAFADQTALGLDPTMRMPKGADFFLVNIDGKRYQVRKRPIADHRARALHGKGGDQRGLAIYDRAMKAIKEIEKSRPEKLKLRPGENAENYFVNISGDEEVMVNGVRDDTAGIMGGKQFPKGTVWIKTARGAQTGTDDTTGTLSPIVQNSDGGEGRKEMSLKGKSREVPVSQHIPTHQVTLTGRTASAATKAPNPYNLRQIHHRVHYRTVMDNIGEPLHHIARLDIAFKALADVVQACKMMCIAGFNHRDLSAGNIIVDAKEERGRLSDLEFAKIHTSDGAGHHVRTGTPDFMAVEVLRGFYMFDPNEPEDGDKDFPLRHNAGHDLESIFWIAIFMLYNSEVDDEDPGKHAMEQRKRRDEIFSKYRRVAFGAGNQLCYKMAEHFDGPGRRSIMYLLDMQNSLIDAYQTFEAALSDTDRGKERNTEFLEVHDEFGKPLIEMSKLFKGKKCERVDDILRANQRKLKPTELNHEGPLGPFSSRAQNPAEGYAAANVAPLMQDVG
ncbi:hypothetical protein DACRYDRAFT_106971 [Dacryopinax primogenitus]|uniref:Protein kinase domain-containing protein n=1 Tax=Dacryopinax primogenitus (strain DJM 731) TaxID=1858805 RepID=M5FXW4_DACPD|nr:uncharacterized protein DACRYDRAFT_106971 [Dacryopinax primogenitus]EJU02886.1 hypothetical protein DACRYDRAFT_106971 [Dacryopinax primogenitus]